MTPSARLESHAPRVRAFLGVGLTLCICACYEVEGLAVGTPVEGLVVGDTVTLSLVRRDGSTPTGPGIVWASTDTAIATVDGSGVVTGVGPGVAGIDVWAGDYHLRLPVLVWAPAGPFTTIDVGGGHGCGLAEDGQAWCWGADPQAQLGTLTYFDRCELGAFVRCAVGAVPVDGEERFTELALGSSHSCALTAAGMAYCWGQGYGGELREPAPVLDSLRFTSLDAGESTTCGTTLDGDLICWGLARSFSTGSPSGAAPTHVAPDRDFSLVATGGSHTCGVTTDGATLCWGSNSHGQLGVELVDRTCGPDPCTPTPQEVLSAPPFVGLALGPDFSCGLAEDGVAWCWGRNDRGQLGDGTRIDRWAPIPVSGGHVFGNLGAGWQHACGVDDAGRLLCWGSDRTGFGNGGEGPDAAIEVDVPEVGASGLLFASTVVDVSIQCGLDATGGAWCWGANGTAQLGNGTAQRVGRVTTPTRVVRHPTR